MDEYVLQLTIQGFDEHGRSAMVNIRGKTVEEFDATLAHVAERLQKITAKRPEAQAEQVVPQQTQAVLPVDDATNGTSLGDAVAQNTQQTFQAVKIAIAADRGGLPVLEFYAAGHKFADAKYSLGKDKDTRVKNICALMANFGWKPEHIAIGNLKEGVNVTVTWKPSKDGKYKDIVGVSK